jgi:predicted TIM-barrel fold metal-dependent hydrolase
MLAALLLSLLARPASPAPQDDPPVDPAAAKAWREQRRLADVHVHVEATEERYERATRLLSGAGIGLALNLSGGTVTKRAAGADGDARSDFERHRDLVAKREASACRFLLAFNLDYGGFDEPDFAERAARQVEEAARLGAAALKEYKRLGLSLRDSAGKLIPVDTPKLDLAWEKCGELSLPVFLHVADPKAFWAPLDEKNERWQELKDHPDWWFGDPAKHPPRDELFDQLLRVVGRHPRTTFVAVHFADDPEELGKVDAWLGGFPNLFVDVAARIPEIGRRSPTIVRPLFLAHADRILLGTDFQVYDRLTLGSGGSGPPPGDDDARSFFDKHWRFFETSDRGFAHMTPIQGDWTIDAIGLPEDALRRIYFDNARAVLARGWPETPLRAKRATKAVTLGGLTTHPAWEAAPWIALDQDSESGRLRPEVGTSVRALWTEEALLLDFHCHFRELTTREKPDLTQERLGLWEGDVVELFVGRDAEHPNRYFEFELAPDGEKLDVAVELPEKSFEWSSGFQGFVHVDGGHGVWHAQMSIPFAALGGPPKPGERWRANVFRCDRALRAALALRPTLAPSFHVPGRFTTLSFDE